MNHKTFVARKIPKSLQVALKCRPPPRYCRLHHHSPKTLVELCGEVVDRLPFPKSWYWTIDEVASWVANELGFPQYKECFAKNLIDGKRLLIVDAAALPRMNICDFDHIKIITAGIRKLYGTSLERFARKKYLPTYSPEEHYLRYRVRYTGTRMEFFYKTHLVEPPLTFQVPCVTERLPPYKQIIPRV